MRSFKVLLISCISWFVFLCFFHYFSARGLWLDENFILKNLESLQTPQILGPLSSSQAFPRIYLIAIKLFSQKFDYNVLSLRFFPLLSMLAAFFIWAKIYQEELSGRWQALLALFLFSSSYHLSYYAAELKHYSMDVLVVAIFSLYMIRLRQLKHSPSKLFIGATLMLPLTLFLSYSSFFIFWVVIYNFLFILKENRKILPLLIIYTSMCFLFGVFIYFFDLKYTLSTSALFSYWSDYFVCTDTFYCFIKSFGEGLRKMSVWWFGNSSFFRRIASFFIPFFVLSLFGYGIKSLKKGKFRLLTIDSLGIIIFLELVILGATGKYPFTGARITLFFAPFVFYFIVKGISFCRRNRALYLGFSVFCIIFLIMCSVNSF